MRENKGFSIIEVILAGALLAVIVFGIVSAWLYGEHALIRAGDNGRGIAIASEGIELVRSLRDADFGVLQDGTYALLNDGHNWTLVPNEKEVIGVFSRTITIASDGISKRNITSTVNWTNADGTPGSISSSTVLSNWQQQRAKTSSSRPTVLQITNVQSSPAMTSVIITWDTNKPATSRVEYGTTASYGTLTAVTDTAPMVTSHSVEITGLALDTTYHFRVTSIDATAYQAYSLDDTFRTAVDDQPPVISNVAISSTGTTAVVIVWDTDEASSSYITYRPTAGGATLTTSETDTLTRVLAHEVLITGLTEVTQYDYEVHSRDSSGNLGSSTTHTFTTLGPLPEITNVHIIARGTTYFTIGWTTDVLADSRVGSNNNDFPPSDILDMDPMVTEHSVTISGLNPCTPYNDVYVRSKTPTSSLNGVPYEGTITTKGCGVSALSEFNAQIANIDAISIRESDPGDQFTYVYAINTDASNPELSVFTVRSNGEVEHEDYYDYKFFDNYSLGRPKAIYALRDRLIILHDSASNQAALFDIGLHPTEPQFINYFDFNNGKRPFSITVRDIPYAHGTEIKKVLFAGFPGQVEMVDIQNYFNANDWSQMGTIPFSDTKAEPWDLYVSQPDSLNADTQWLYAITDNFIRLADVTDAVVPGSSTNIDYSEVTNGYHPQIGGNDGARQVIASPQTDLIATMLGGTSTSHPNFGKYTRAISDTSNSSYRMFLNGDGDDNDPDKVVFRILRADGSEFAANATLDLTGGYFDSSSYHTNESGATVGYMSSNSYIFFSRLNKIVIIDPDL